MRKRWLVLLLSLTPSVVWAQCNGYGITSKSTYLLSPSEAAAQGWTTGTIVVQSNGMDSSGDPGVRSHNLTQTMGTGYTLYWRGLNFPSGAYATFTVAQTKASWGATLSTTWQSWPISSSNYGPETFVFTIYDSGGHVLTTDRVTITGTSGASGLISFQDGVPTNAYYELTTKFAGGSMMNSCNECQLHPNMCINKTHTPLFDANLTNPQSGETQTISNASAGNVVSENQSLSGSSSIMISVLPGDSPSGSTTDKVFCTMFGWIMAQQWNPGLPDVEWAVTAEEIIPSSCTLVLRFFQQGDDWGIQCNVAWKKPPATADRCSAASQVPDFNPAAQWDEQNCKTPGNCNASDMPPPNGTNASYPKYWYHASWGIRFPPGAPNPDPPILNGGAHNWTFPIYIADGYVPAGPDEDWWILDLLNLAIPKGTGLPIDCTYRDKGLSPIQNPF